MQQFSCTLDVRNDCVLSTIIMKALKCLTLGSETSNKYFSIIMIVWLSTKFWSVVIDNHSVVV